MDLKLHFLDLRELKLIGLGTRFISILLPNKPEPNPIPALWASFIQQICTIKNSSDPYEAYGVIEMLPDSKDEMFYMASTRVDDFTAVPPGMISRQIPAARYALFTHKGPLTQLEETMKFIYVTWLPKSGIHLRNAPHLEHYDHRFKLDSDQSEFDILLPVR
jgi:AraC family transcriptional regulator